MMIIKVSGTGLQTLDKAMRQLSGNAAGRALSIALNDTGKVAANKVRSAVAKQTGVAKDVIARRGGIATKPAYPGRLDYRIIATGRYLKLKDFRPAQQKKGVKASPWGKRQFFRGAFINPGIGGHVFHRVGKPRKMKSGTYEGKIRQPIENMFGPAIPKEIIQGHSAHVFKTYVAQALPKKVDKQLKRAAKGAFD